MEIINNPVAWFFLVIVLLGVFMLGRLLGQSEPKKKKRTSKYPKCDCSDVNQCSKYCHAKYCFSKDFADGKI
jgi:hypothetical protein